MSTQEPEEPQEQLDAEAPDQEPLPADREWPHIWQGPFLKSLSLIPDVSAACRVARVSRNHAYRTRNAVPEFARAWLEALELARDFIQRQAHQLATTGLPVHKRRVRQKFDAEGKVIERIEEEYDDVERSATMMIFWLKAWYPDRYRWSERHEHTGRDGGPVEVLALSEIDRQIETLRAELEQRAAADGEPVPVE